MNSPLESLLPASLVVSLVASFLSVSYNVGRAVMYQITGQWGFLPDASAVVAGLYTIGALLLRLYALITLLVLIGLSFSSPISIIVMSLYLLVGICALAYVNGLLAHLQSGEEMCSWKGQVKIIVSSYICATIGPLYPVIENRKRRPWILGVAILINMLPDVVVLIISMVESGEIFSACKPGFSESYIYPFMSCHQYIAYVTAVVGLSILPGIILCRLSNQQAQTCNHSEEEPIRNGPLVPL